MVEPSGDLGVLPNEVPFLRLEVESPELVRCDELVAVLWRDREAAEYVHGILVVAHGVQQSLAEHLILVVGQGGDAIPRSRDEVEGEQLLTYPVLQILEGRAGLLLLGEVEDELVLYFRYRCVVQV